MKVLITGGTGFIGRALAEDLRRVGMLPRIGSRSQGNPTWDPSSCPPPPDLLEGIQAIVHLAGENIAAGRWTRRKMQRIRDSRVLGTRNLVEGIRLMHPKPSVLISGSAIGYYGDRGDDLLDEGSSCGKDFLAGVCREWEMEANEAIPLGVRVVNLRIGIVLGREGGALARMVKPFRLGVGGPLAGGRFWMSWIHMEDLLGIIRLALLNDRVSGPLNAVAPHPVTNREFSTTLGTVLNAPSFLPTPYFLLRAAIGKLARVIVSSQKVVPKRALEFGYTFKYPTLEESLRNLLAPV